MMRWWSAGWSLLAAAAAVAVSVAVVLVVHRQAEPPISVDAARVHADVAVMPNRQVAAYLRAHGITHAALRRGGGTAVVVHATWTAVRPAHGAHYEVFLAGGRCRAGVLDSYAGVPDGAGSLGLDGRWAARLEQTPGLAADAGRASLAQSLAVPASYGGVWAVGRVLDACVTGPSPVLPHAVDDPQPVVGVGLATRDHVWWLTRA